MNMGGSAQFPGNNNVQVPLHKPIQQPVIGGMGVNPPMGMQQPMGMGMQQPMGMGMQQPMGMQIGQPCPMGYGSGYGASYMPPKTKFTGAWRVFLDVTNAEG